MERFVKQSANMFIFVRGIRVDTIYLQFGERSKWELHKHEEYFTHTIKLDHLNFQETINFNFWEASHHLLQTFLSHWHEFETKICLKHS